MMTRILGAATAALTLATAHANTPLTVKVYTSDANSFHVNSTLVYGDKEALVIDAGFTRADALRIAANVLDSGRQLKTILVSQADPDYYFGAETLKQIFPNAEVLATPAVIEKINAKLASKVGFWGAKMGLNAPKNPVVPKPLNGTLLSVDGQTVEVRGTTGTLAHRPYVWIPSAKTITGTIAVFGSGLHVWTADTQTLAERAAWVAALDEMAALNPTVVVPGHMASGNAMDASAIAHTKQYLETFEKNLVTAKQSADLIDSMKRAYPDAKLGIALDIGAKVSKGEMKW